MKHVLGIYNSKNKRFRKDGDEFKREALEWARVQPGIVKLVDVQDGFVRREIRAMNTGLDVLAIFDHGRPQGLPRMRENLGNVKGLAQTIANVSGITNQTEIILYSCSCGRGWWGRWGFRWMDKRNKADIEVMGNDCSPRNGYAMVLCAELQKLGVEAVVWAHLTRGHTTYNPHVVYIYRPFSLMGEVWRRRHISPSDSEWKYWKLILKGPHRFLFWH